MSHVDDKQIAIARVYGQSMLELASQQQAQEALLSELEELVSLMQSDPQLADFMASPLIDTALRERSLEKIFRGNASDLLVNALQVLNRKGRLGFLPAVVEQYRLAYQEQRGVIEVQVKTAVPLTQRLRHKLKASLSSFTGKDAHLVEEVDELLIGGLVLQVDDRKIDASVLRHLHEVRDVLHRRAAEEIFKARRTDGVADDEAAAAAAD